MKPTKCPAREKKGPEKRKKRGGGGKTESKSQDCCVTFKPCACPNFASGYFASGSEGCEVYNL